MALAFFGFLFLSSFLSCIAINFDYDYTLLVLSYLVENGVVFIVLCEFTYPRKLAFHYLQDIQKEFEKFDKTLIGKITRPYSFVKFGNSLEPLVCYNDIIVKHLVLMFAK